MEQIVNLGAIVPFVKMDIDKGATVMVLTYPGYGQARDEMPEGAVQFEIDSILNCVDFFDHVGKRIASL